MTAAAAPASATPTTASSPPQGAQEMSAFKKRPLCTAGSLLSSETECWQADCCCHNVLHQWRTNADVQDHRRDDWVMIWVFMGTG